jgi:adenine-specific DNA-methyltransferase
MHFPLRCFHSAGEDSCWRWSGAKLAREDIASGIPVVIAKQRRDGGWNIYECSRKSTTRAKSIWLGSEVISEQGTIELGELGLADMFDHPKPVGLVKTCLQIATDDDDIVLDFFSGSSTAAHAVLDLNRADGCRRRFIMVQLPQPSPDNSAATNCGFATIADVGKERIRRTITKLTEDSNGKLELKDRDSVEDLGFQVFKLTESNYRRWVPPEEKSGEKLAEQMALFNEPLLPGWNPDNVIYEILLKEGLSLTSRIEQLTGNALKPNTVYRVSDPARNQSLLVCLDDKLDPKTSKALKLGLDDTFICRDVSLSDELAANLALQCRLKTI